jgi:hypothetical protein
MTSSLVIKCCAVTLCALLLLGELTSAAPAYGDSDALNLYDLLQLRNELINERLNHQVVRKAGRDPSLRLRFGRRADPLWQQFTAEESAANEGTSAN